MHYSMVFLYLGWDIGHIDPREPDILRGLDRPYAYRTTIDLLMPWSNFSRVLAKLSEHEPLELSVFVIGPRANQDLENQIVSLVNMKNGLFSLQINTRKGSTNILPTHKIRKEDLRWAFWSLAGYWESQVVRRPNLPIIP